MMLSVFNQQLKLAIGLNRFNHFMPIIPNPPLNIIKLQFTLADNLQQLPRRHAFELSLCQRHGHRAHFSFNIQLFKAQAKSLEHYNLVTINRRIDQFVNSRNLNPIHQVSLS